MEDPAYHKNHRPQWEQYYSVYNVGILVVNVNGIIEYVNSAFVSQFETVDDIFTGKPLSMYMKNFNIEQWHKKDSQSFQWQFVSIESAKYLIRLVKTPTRALPYFVLFCISASELNDFIPQLNLNQDLHEEIMAILDSIYDGIYITDGEGTTIMMNKAAEKTGGRTAEQLIGKNMRDLVADGYCSESVSLKVIEEKKPVTIIQKCEDGTELLVTGVPYFKNGKIKMVITSERDITELNALKKQYENQKSMTKKFQSELQYLRSQSTNFDDIVFVSDEMQSAVDLALRVAKLDTTVLIQGESGVGKEVFAKIIYNNSLRRKGPFIKINCGAIPESLMESELFGYEGGAFTGSDRNGKAGLFELAHNGTLFLDEIGELPLNLQVKLLRAIQEKEIRRIGAKDNTRVNVRIIAATNRDLADAVRQNKFRADLFYRLNVVPITIPPLRSRKEDVKHLAYYFLRKFNLKYKLQKCISPEAISVLTNYDWPGNVRELENMIERVMVTTTDDMIQPHHFASQLCRLKNNNMPISFQEFTSLKEEMAKFEKNLILAALSRCNSTEELAKLFKVDRSTIIRKLHKYKIKNIYAGKE